MGRIVTLAVLVALSVASPARAQQWGLSVGLTPSWETGAPVRHLFRADQIDMHGSEVRFGVIRGDLLGGDWGFSFVDKSIDEDSTLDIDVTPCGAANCGTFYRTLERTRLTGIEFHQFQPFKTWRERVQLGMVGAVGIGWLRGEVAKRIASEDGNIESLAADPGELFPPSTSIVPLMKLELAVAGIIAPGLKVRAGGGFSMPGYHRFGVTLFYLIPQR